MHKLLAVTLFCGSIALGTALADQPLKLAIQAEGVNLPEGSICRAELGAEYRIVERRVSPNDRGNRVANTDDMNDRGNHVANTDDMATFTASAAEHHKWMFVATKYSQASKSNGREEFEFTIPAGLPHPRPGSRAAIYVPVNYTVAVPGFPEIKQQQTFKVRLEDKATERISRCLRFEVINGGTQLRVGLLPTCNHTFEQLGAVPLATRD